MCSCENAQLAENFRLELCKACIRFRMSSFFNFISAACCRCDEKELFKRTVRPPPIQSFRDWAQVDSRVLSSRKNLTLRLERHRPNNISYTVHFLIQDTISTTFTADGVQEFTLMISSPKEKSWPLFLAQLFRSDKPSPHLYHYHDLSFCAHVNCAKWRHLERDRIPSDPTTYRLQLVFHQMLPRTPHPPRAFRSQISTILTTYPMHHLR